MKKVMRKVQIFAVISVMAVCMFSVINLNTEKVYADGDTPCIISSVYSVDEENLLIGELQGNTVEEDAFKKDLSASPKDAAINVYADDGITPKTGLIVSGDKVKISYNGLNKIYTVETYSIINGEKIYPGYIADTSMGYAVPGDDGATDKPVPMGFNFNYFGNSFNSAYIDINGFISFNSLAVQRTEPLNYSTVFTRNSVPYNIIAAFLSDITVQNIGQDKAANPQYVPSIYYKTIGIAPNRQFIVQWTNMYFWKGSIQFADLQVILNEGSDKIQLQYRTLLDTNSPYYGTAHAGFGADATVGLKGPAKEDTSSDQISYMIKGCNSAGQSILLHQGQAISFTPDGKGGYTMVDSDAQYEKVYLKNPLTPSVSLISESAGMTPDKATNVSKNAKIGWQGSALAERYRLAVATTETFSNIVYNIDGIKDTYFQFDNSHPLQADTAYYWKVESINDSGSSFSPVYSFTTGEDSALSNLSADAGTWNTPFASGTTEYTINVPYGTSSIAFTPIAVDASSVIKINGDIVSNGTASKNITLNAVSNTIVILVTAPNSTSKTYTITVTRAKQPAPELTGFTWAPGNAEGTTQTVTTPSGILMYIVGAEGSETRPNIGDSADAYKDALSLNTDIAVNSGDHLYIVSVDTSGSAIAWTDAAVSDANIKTHEEPAELIYSAIFNSQGGSTVAKINNIISGTSITEPIAPTRSGYTFNGWYKESGCINKWDFNTDIVTHNVILYAGWVSNTAHDYDNDPKDTDTPKVKDSIPVSTTVKGSIVDNSTGTEVSTVPVKVTADSNGNSKITLDASQIIVLKKPDGEKSTLSDESKITFDTTANTPITMKSDGTIQISNLSKGTENKLNITYDLGSGQKIIIGTIDIKVDSNGNIDFTSSLIDPYGTLTDSLSGEPIRGAKITLYYADTDRNKSSGKKADTVVELPGIEGFKPNNNKNPQITDTSGAYGFMVYPNTDYYMVVSKDGYDTFKSPVIAVGNELVKYSARLNPPVNGVKRIAGDTRIDTAIQLAKSEFNKKVNNVILSTADNYPDALSGSVLAYQQKAPILLVGHTQEDRNKVLEYIKDNVNPAGNVYILGGTGAVGEDVVKQIKSMGFANTIRLGGIDRYETSAKIADYLKAAQGTPVILVSGRNYPDALSVSSPGAVNQYPVLLVNNGDIDNYVKNVLSELKPDKIYIIGNEGVIRDNIKNNLEQITALKSDNIVRIGGDDRYKTSAAVAKYFNLPGQSICVTTGRNFPDALAGSIYAANFNAPVILVDGSLNNDIVTYIKDKKLTGITVFGGNSAISKDTQLKLLQIIGK